MRSAGRPCRPSNLRATQRSLQNLGRASKEERDPGQAGTRRTGEGSRGSRGAADAEADRLVVCSPTLSSAAVSGEEDFVVVTGSTPARLRRQVSGQEDHLAIGKRPKMRSTRSAARFGALCLRGIGVAWAGPHDVCMDQALANGFVPMMAPTLVTPQVMGGWLPQRALPTRSLCRRL